MHASAKWIWPADEREAVDFYWLARREFALPSAPQQARFEIAACDRYRLFVNGRLVGEGPARSQWPEIYADRYELDELPLRRGRNAVAVIVHNTGLAQHGQPPGPGGLLAHLSATCGGRRVNVPTNSSWRQAPALQYVRPAPRRMFTVGFAELCDLRRVPKGWAEPGFDGAEWAPADVVAAQPAEPYTDVKACPLPRLVVEPTRPAAVGACGTAGGLKGISGLPFEFCVFCRSDEEFYGASFVHSPSRRKVRLEFAADNRAAVFLNNHRVLCQAQDDQFFNHLYYETDTYTGLYYGHGHRVGHAMVTLEKGWNSLGVVLGAPAETWGFVLRFADRKTGRTVPLRFSPNRSSTDVPAWHVVTDAHLLDGCDGMLLETPQLNAGMFPSPAHLAAWEPRRKTRVEGAQALLGGGRKALKLPPDHFVTYRMPAEIVGGIELEVRGEPGAVLDVTAGEVLQKNGCVASLRDGVWLTDRIIVSKRWTRWRSLDRRAMRHVELAARNATRPIELRNLRVQAMHYVPPAPGSFRCSDRLLNKLWDVGRATLDACTKEQFEDCPIREMAQWFGDTVVEGQVAAVAWGDEALTAKALRQFAADQPVDGWMRPMVPSGYGDTLTDYAMLLPYLLHRHHMHWGDAHVLRDCFTGVARLVKHAERFVGSDGFIAADPNPKHMVYLDHTLGRSNRRWDVITGYQAAYAVCLDRAAAVAELLGQKAKASRWRREHDRVRGAVGRLFDKGRGLFADGMNGDRPGGRFSATTNYWMLFAGLADAKQEKSILERLWPTATREPDDLWPPAENPYFKYFVLEALFSRGRWAEAFAVLKNYYGPMLQRRDCWTLYETYDPKTPASTPVRSNSHCHAYGAGPLVHYFRWICGIRPAAPGFRSIVVEPQLGPLRSLEASMHTPAGEVSLTVRRQKRGRRIRVSAPDGVPVELRPTYLSPGDRLEVA